MRTGKKEYTIKSDWMGSLREGPSGENLTATQINELRMEQDLIEETVKRAAKEFQEEMDWSILADLYKETGWVEIEFNPIRPTNQAYEISRWLEKNCKGHRTSRGKRFLFQLESDAVNFVLKWVD